MDFFYSFFTSFCMFSDFEKEKEDALSEYQNSHEYRIMKMAEEIKPSLKGNNNLNSSIEVLDYNSIDNIQKILLSAVDWIFEGAQKMFFNAKKIFYIVSMLLMIYDAYR